MRDVDFPPDEDHSGLLPDDPEEQLRYLKMFRGRYAEDIAQLAPPDLEAQVHAALHRCPTLVIRAPNDVLRFLRLTILVMPGLRGSPLLERVVDRIITAVEDWSATKRLDFIDKHIIGRPLPSIEPDFGPWWDGQA